MANMGRKLSVFNIKCQKCLDSGRLWKERDILEKVDGLGSYAIYNCNECSDGSFISVEKRNELYFNNKPIVHVDCFIHEKEEVIDKYYFRNKYSVSDDNRSYEEAPLWYDSKKDIIKINIDKKNVKIAIEHIVNELSRALSLSESNLLELKEFIENLTIDINLSVSDKEINKEEYKQFIDANGKQTFLLLEISNIINNTTCFAVSCCNFSSRVSTLYINYRILKPKNEAAINICNNLMSEKIMVDL